MSELNQVISRLQILARQKSNQPINYYKFYDRDEPINFHGADITRIIFAAHSIEEAILLVREYLLNNTTNHWDLLNDLVSVKTQNGDWSNNLQENIDWILNYLQEQPYRRVERLNVYNQIEPCDDIYKLSVESLIKQLYYQPITLPDFLIINGIRSNFISFNQIRSIGNQITRYVIDPLLQPLAGLPGSPNRIITIFTKNGNSYLVKARFDPQTNQIFPPI